jgi:hypothetical protein
MEEVPAQFFHGDQVGGLAKAPGQLLHGTDIRHRDPFDQIPQLHILDHSLPWRCHDYISCICELIGLQEIWSEKNGRKNYGEIWEAINNCAKRLIQVSLR